MGYKNVFRDPYGFPQWQSAGLPVESKAVVSSETGSAQQGGPRPLAGAAILWTLAGVFAGGLALNLTPCVYPLIPITVSYFGSRTGQSRRRLAANGLLYLLGLSTTNSVLGVLAALTGSLMGSVLQSPLVLTAIAGILVFFAASLFGFWEVRLPHQLTAAASRSFGGYFGSLFMGLSLGIVAAPCIGPFVLGLLTWVAVIGSPWFGFLIFFVLSLGLGLPLLILGVFSGSLERLPGSGQWMLWVRQLMGWVLIGMAVYFVRPLLPATVNIFLLSGAALAAALHLGWFSRATAESRGFQRLRTSAAMTGFVLATYLIGSWYFVGPGVSWQPYSAEILSEAREMNKPVIVDFSASWCTPCRRLDEVVFHDPDVVNQAESHFTMIKIDLTRKNPAHERLVAQYGVKGVPTVIFIDGQGREKRDLRIVDFLPPDRFLIRMAQVARSKGLGVSERQTKQGVRNHAESPSFSQ
ncbi:MAG: cytochrome c biogenesis protein CcdA [Desulfomonilaceae bacterium]|nr:cytochrome c biogenesis protein CcdA [Desulfomonilaceae bacterium]